MTEPKRGFEWHGSSWTLLWWTGTGFWSIKLCRTLDGRFSDSGTVLAPFGARRERRVSEFQVDPSRHRTRTTLGWRAWCPYIMLWRMNNTQDHDIVEVPDGDPRIGTTVRQR